MASKKPARVIAKKSAPARSVGKDAKMKKEISGSFGKGARHEGTNVSGKKVAPVKAKSAGYAGEFIVNAVLTVKEKTEIMNLIRNTAKTGPRDPNDQVVDIKETKTGLRIRTTENHLAVAIAKKVARAHKGGTLEIVWPEGDPLSRATWTREEKKTGKKK